MLAPIFAMLLALFFIATCKEPSLESMWTVPVILLGWYACMQADKIAELTERHKDLEKQLADLENRKEAPCPSPQS